MKHTLSFSMSSALSSGINALRHRLRAFGLKNGLCVVMLLGLALPLTACGKKPGHVDAPPGAAANGFPHTYPDPETNEDGIMRPVPTTSSHPLPAASRHSDERLE